MVAWLSVLSGVIGLLAAAIFWTLSVWSEERRARATTQAGTALSAFAIWWGGIALVLAVRAFGALLTAVGVDDPTLLLTMMLFMLLPLTLAMAGLAHYSLYLFVGIERRAFVIGGSIILYALATYALLASAPFAVELVGGAAVVVPADGFASLLRVAAVAYAIVPAFAFFGFIRLYLHEPPPPARARVGGLLVTVFAWVIAAGIAAVAPPMWAAILPDLCVGVGALALWSRYRVAKRLESNLPKSAAAEAN